MQQADKAEAEASSLPESGKEQRHLRRQQQIEYAKKRLPYRRKDRFVNRHTFASFPGQISM